MFICTFAGHAEVYKNISSRLSETIENCLKNTNEAIFYVGGRGEFDAMAANAVRAMIKSRHKNMNIRLYLVEPYMRIQLNRNKDYYAQLYDSIIIPSELMGVHTKSAITMRNRLMVDWSDLLIAYVHRDFGGAAQTLQYAQCKHKTIINLAEKTAK